MTKHKPLPLVMVVWDDASHIEGGWKDSRNLMRLTPARMHSVGWVLERTKRSIVLIAHGCNEQRVAQGEMCIPRGCIIKIHKLKVCK